MEIVLTIDELDKLIPNVSSIDHIGSITNAGLETLGSLNIKERSGENTYLDDDIEYLFEVIDEHKFFLNVIKYGVTFKVFEDTDNI